MAGWLVLASGHDVSAHWACRYFRGRGHQCELVLTEWLQDAEVRWRHRVSAVAATVEVVLAGGRRLRSGEFTAVLNRALLPPLTAMARAGEDAAYAQSEQSAFSLSWLHAFAPVVVNPPTPRGLAGEWRSALEWRALAAEAGLDHEVLEADSASPGGLIAFPEQPPNGLVIGDEAFGAAARPSVSAAAIALARRAGTPLLGLWLTGDRLAMATPNPDLSVGGTAGLAALERVLSG